MPQKVLCIMGPTGVGKTALAMRLAESPDWKGRVDVISVDSAMIYRGMNIGTAKPTLAEQARVPHQLIDVCDPDQRYSVGQFCIDARQAIERSLAADRLPVLVGGTMMYFDRLQRGIIEVPEIPRDIDAEVQRMLQGLGVSGLHDALAQVDPRLAKRLHPNDSQRIMRGMAVYLATQRPLSVWQQTDHASVSDDKWCNVGILPADRSELHQRLEQRFALMIKQGLHEEVVSLVHQYALNANSTSMRCVGYRQMLAHIHGELSYQDMVDKANAATRQLAKRQMTWMRSWPGLLTYSGDLAKLCDKILTLLQ